MKIETLETAGILPAIRAMRNPLNSWDKSDSEGFPLMVGEADKALSMKLAAAGDEHAKHLRMIMVWADITAPREWFIQLDTYRIGVEKVSCSTMHTLMKRHLTDDDFECDCIPEPYMDRMLQSINAGMDLWRMTTDVEEKKKVWRGIIEMLPQSFLQKRTYMFSYAALRNIYLQRKGHKLKEWEAFREWCRSLPESWMITDGDEE